VSPRLAERPGHRATTANAEAIYPFFAANGLGEGGVFIGTDLHGSAFTYDPFVLYERRIVSNPNLFVAGEVGAGKSSLVKSYLYRQALFGRVPWIADPKGEYTPLAHALDVEPIRLVPGGSIRLNPIAREAGWDGQLNLLRALAAGALGRRLDPEEEGALREALRVVNADLDAEPTLPAAVTLLFRPVDVMAERLYTTMRALAERSREAALGLQRLCEGDLRGMFDGPTTPGLHLDGRAVVLDLSAFYDSAALGLVMTCASAWERGMIARLHAEADRENRAPRKMINVFDEAWRALAVLGVGEWLQAAFKLSRRDGVQNVVVMHRLSDLSAAGAAGSRQRELAEGLLHDAQTRVIYRQVPDNVARTQELLGLTTVEAELLPELDDGIALWKVGNRSFLVQHLLSQIEVPLVDTDRRMLDGAGRASL
jgi:type IV secretory pathway VirB4 component